MQQQLQQCATIQVIDPANRTGKIQVPLAITSDTVGRTEWLNTGCGQKKDVSLCMLYQQRRCNAGFKCNQIHAEKAYISKLRQQAEAGNPRCCPHHDGLAALKLPDVRLQLQNGVSHEISPMVLSRTATLDALIGKTLPGTPLVISTSRVCRLHQRNACKYGKDCKNIHVCHEVGAAIAQGVAPRVSQQVAPCVPTLPRPRNAKRRMSKDTVLTTPPNEKVVPDITDEVLALEMFQAAFKGCDGARGGEKKAQRKAKKGKRAVFAEKCVDLSASCGSDVFGDSFAKICLPQDLLLSPV